MNFFGVPITLPATYTSYLTSLFAVLLGYRIVSFFLRGPKWSPKGVHYYITGGSSGLGLATAERLTRLGAHVSIVARDEAKLAKALESLEKNRENPDQILKSYSYSIHDLKGATAALEAASAAHGGKSPEVFLLCAGLSKPMFFMEMTEEDQTRGMTNAYWLQAWSAQAAAKMMVKQGVRGKIVFVGSMLSFMSFVGYASYSPGKYALKGLADCLRNELLLYGITVQMYFANGILSPGFEEEKKTRPEITTKIEEGDTPMSPDEAAKVFLDGVKDGDVYISGDFLTSLFRASTRGSTPRVSFVYDAILDLIAFVAMPIWRRAIDGMVAATGPAHMAYLKEKNVL
ncbi:NAD(P)-binding protein [Clavulina sp. PMI_390]|nr:NAD(P)-binding protein [Clavulina sp. PMI_390]